MNEDEIIQDHFRPWCFRFASTIWLRFIRMHCKGRDVILVWRAHWHTPRPVTTGNGKQSTKSNNYVSFFQPSIFTPRKLMLTRIDEWKSKTKGLYPKCNYSIDLIENCGNLACLHIVILNKFRLVFNSSTSLNLKNGQKRKQGVALDLILICLAITTN